MKLRVAPLYAKMWRQSSSLESRPTFAGVVEGAHEHWAHLARLPRYRRVDTYRRAIGFLGLNHELAPPHGVPRYIQPRGEP